MPNSFYLQYNSPPNITTVLQEVRYSSTAAQAYVNTLFTYEQPLILIPPVNGFALVNGTPYTAVVTTEQDPTLNGVYRPAPGLYRFKLVAYAPNNVTLAEYSYTDFLLQPEPDAGLAITAILTGASASTPLILTYMTSYAMPANSTFVLSFTTNDYINDIFPVDLGLTAAGVQATNGGALALDCAEAGSDRILTLGAASADLSCYLIPGSITEATPVPATVTFVAPAAVPAGANLTIYVAMV